MVGVQFGCIHVNVIVEKYWFLLFPGFGRRFQFRHVIPVGADGFPDRVLVKINGIHSVQGIEKNPVIVKVIM